VEERERTDSGTGHSVRESETAGAKGKQAMSYWARLNDIVGCHGHSLDHVLSLFPAYVKRQQMTRFLALYELFKHTIDLPGCIVDVGVFRGYSFFTFHKLMETFCPGDRRRKVFGFEHFAGLTQFVPEDGRLDPRDGKVEGGYGSSMVRDEILGLIDLHNDDNLIPGVPRSHLVEGDVLETVPRFLEDNPGLRIALLHLDVDLYKPTRFCLEQFYPLVLTGGVVVLDEYGLIPWQGESRAADEYFEQLGHKPSFKKFPWSSQPHGYFLKP